jgi:hypothetical protein
VLALALVLVADEGEPLAAPAPPPPPVVDVLVSSPAHAARINAALMPIIPSAVSAVDVPLVNDRYRFIDLYLQAPA